MSKEAFLVIRWKEEKCRARVRRDRRQREYRKKTKREMGRTGRQGDMQRQTGRNTE